MYFKPFLLAPHSSSISATLILRGISHLLSDSKTVYVVRKKVIVNYVYPSTIRGRIAYSNWFLFMMTALRVKAESSFMLNWAETTGSKPFDTTSIFDMIMAHNSNFNGHDQQVCRQSSLCLLFVLAAFDFLTPHFSFNPHHP